MVAEAGEVRTFPVMPEIPKRVEQSYTARRRRRAMPAAGPVTIRRADGSVTVEPANQRGKVDRPTSRQRKDSS